MSGMRRYLPWMLGVSLSALLVYFAPEPDEDVVAPGVRSASSVGVAATLEAQSLSSSMSQRHLLSIRPRQVSDELALVFSTRLGVSESKGQQELPPPVVMQVAAPEVAPPLPFKFIGRYVEEGQTKFFLQNREQDIVVQVGDTIQQLYRVEAMSASTLTFTFIPLNEKQTLNFGNEP
jgi:hypothetical protein